LEQGRAVGLGTHKELLATCLTYRRLWEAQGSYGSSEVLSESTPQLSAETTGT